MMKIGNCRASCSFICATICFLIAPSLSTPKIVLLGNTPKSLDLNFLASASDSNKSTKGRPKRSNSSFSLAMSRRVWLVGSYPTPIRPNTKYPLPVCDRMLTSWASFTNFDSLSKLPITLISVLEVRSFKSIVVVCPSTMLNI